MTKFIKYLITIILLILFINFLELFFQWIILEDTSSFHLGFNNGYFILNGKQVGLNPFTNMASIVLGAFLFASLDKKKQY